MRFGFRNDQQTYAEVLTGTLSSSAPSDLQPDDDQLSRKPTVQRQFSSLQALCACAVLTAARARCTVDFVRPIDIGPSRCM